MRQVQNFYSSMLLWGLAIAIIGLIVSLIIN